MKLSNISRLHTKLLLEEEGLKDIDKGAKNELDGLDSEIDKMMNIDEKGKDEVKTDDDIINDIIGDADTNTTGSGVDAGADKKDDLSEIENYNPKLNQTHEPTVSGYTLKNVTDQLDGIVKNWFKFAVDYPPDAKEKFLALGERISEISDIVKKEFNA